MRAIPPEFLTSTLRYAKTKGVQRVHPAWQALTHFFNYGLTTGGKLPRRFRSWVWVWCLTDMLALV